MTEVTSATAAAATAGAPAPAVELIGITKAFPGVVANDHISLSAMPGEVLCLLGENGAGKSTLMSILSGLYRPDDGPIRVDGREVTIDSPRRGRELGIGMVYQHLSLIPTLTVLENLMLGSNRGLVLDEKGAKARLAELAGTLGIAVDPDVHTGTLSLGQQQQVEILKALWKGSRVLILDEPTSMLTPQGIAELQKVLVQLKASGLAIIFITHKLHEAVAIGDRLVILKQGRVVGTLGPEVFHGTAPHELQRMIVDDDVRRGGGRGRRRRRAPGGPVGPSVPARDVGRAPARAPRRLGPAHRQPARDQRGLARRARRRDPRGRRRRRQRAARARGGDRRAAATHVRGDQARRCADHEARRLGPPAARPALRDRRPARRRRGPALLGRHEPGPQADRRRALLAARLDRPHVDQRDRARAHQRVRHPDAVGEDDDRQALGRQHPEGAARAGALVRAARRGLQQADPRPGRPDDRDGPRAHPGARGPRRRRRIVISTDLDELIDLSDRVAVLFEGRVAGIVENGPGAETRIGELIVGAQAA